MGRTLVRNQFYHCFNQQGRFFNLCLKAVLLSVIYALSILGQQAQATVLIDDFSTIQFPGVDLQVLPPPTFPISGQDTLAAANTIGGTRDITGDVFSGTDFQGFQAFVGGNLYSHAQDPGVTGRSSVIWDGDLDPTTIDFTGLGGIDLTELGTQDGLEIRILFADQNADLSIEVFTDANNASRHGVTFNNTQLEVVLIVPFTAFTQSGAVGPADFTNVGAIRFNVDGSATPALDVQVQLIQTTSTLVAEKSAVTIVGAGNGLDGGDIIEYTVTITNNATDPVDAVSFMDTVDANSTLLCSSPNDPQLPAGASLTLCDPGTGQLDVAIGTLPAGASVDVIFRVQVDTVLPPNTAEICNQGFVDSTLLMDVPTDNPATFGVPGDETCLDLNGAVTIIKQTSPDGFPQSFDFAGDLGSFSLMDDEQEQQSLPAGTYLVSELVPANWTLTGIVCVDSITADSSVDVAMMMATIELERGESVTCTFTNLAADGTITIIKQTNPDGSTQSFDFTGDLGAFSLMDDQQQSFTVPPGIYGVGENVPAGWTLSGAACDDGSDPAAIGLDPGEAVTCTFNNTELGAIIIIKQTLPDGSPQLFNFTGDLGNFSLTDNQQFSQSVLPGIYGVNESAIAGWQLASAVCDDGSNPASIDIGAGEVVTCTFNNEQDGDITIVKQTVPAGMLQSFNFSGDLGAFSLSHGQSVTQSRPAGVYGVNESVPANWNLLSATCDDGSDPAAINLDPGESVVCTFVNGAVDGTITIIKQTDPDGSPQSFNFSGDLGAFSLADNQQQSFTVPPGAYGVAETGLAGWTLTSATCDDGSNPAAIGLDPGESVTCTFNNAQSGTIIVEKQTDPDGAPDSFTFSGDAAGSIQDNGTIVVGNLQPGTYTSTELVPAGWILTSIACNDNDSSGNIASGQATFQLQAGETVTCTFTNTQNSSITIIKQTDPDGSPQSFNFSGDLGAFSLVDDQQQVFNVAPGTYGVSENALAGWTLSSATCDDGSDPAAIALDPGEAVICTFNNTQSGSIIVEKQTLPDGAPDSFTFSGNAAGSIQDNGAIVVADLQPGTYTSTEAVPAGWDLSSIVCDDNDSTGNIGNGQASFQLQAGETVRCVFTNTQRGSIIVEKQTLPDGAPDSFSFSGDASGSIQDNGTIVVSNLQPGSYTSTEAVPAGWALTGIACDDNDSSGSIANSQATFQLQAGETIRCTFTNTQSGTIIVEKQTDPDGAPDSFTFTGDAAGSIQDNGQIIVNDLLPGTYTATETVPPGWDLSAISCDNDSSSGNVGNAQATFVVQAGETVTCVFNNTQRATIIVEKQTDPDGAPDSFTFTGDAAGVIQDNGTIVVSDLQPGTYTSTEVAPAGWDLSTISCDDNDSSGNVANAQATFVLQAGETVTCVFNNTQRGTVIVEKQTIPDGAPDSFTFTGDASGNIQDNGTIVVTDLQPGTYTSTETVPTSWNLTNISCDDNDSSGDLGTAQASFELQAGETITCVFENTLREPDLSIVKSDGGLPFVGEGEVLVYFLQYSNQSAVDATGVVITETVPTNTVFTAAEGTPGWSCADGAIAGTTCTFNVGTLPATTSDTVQFAVRVLDTTFPDPDTGQCPVVSEILIDNTATIISSEGDSDSSDNSSGAITPVNIFCASAIPVPAMSPKGVLILLLVMLGAGLVQTRRYTRRG